MASGVWGLGSGACRYVSSEFVFSCRAICAPSQATPPPFMGILARIHVIYIHTYMHVYIYVCIYVYTYFCMYKHSAYNVCAHNCTYTHPDAPATSFPAATGAAELKRWPPSATALEVAATPGRGCELPPMLRIVGRIKAHVGFLQVGIHRLGVFSWEGRSMELQTPIICSY